MTHPNANADAAARIKRLQTAIGDGPHATNINVTEHLRHILEVIGDQAALELLEQQKAA